MFARYSRFGVLAPGLASLRAYAPDTGASPVLISRHSDETSNYQKFLACVPLSTPHNALHKHLAFISHRGYMLMAAMPDDPRHSKGLTASCSTNGYGVDTYGGLHDLMNT
jgi:hypothetical protein